MYLILEITRDDYVFYYILKYIPTYVRMDRPSTTTHQTHTKGAKYFYQFFVDTSLLLVVLGPLQEEFHFQGNSQTNDMLTL
jgi:hypothetical protein